MSKELVELTPKEYEAFASEHVLGTYTQSIGQYQLLSKRGRKPYLLGVKINDQVVCASLVMTEKTRFGSVLLFDRGPLIDFDNHELLHFFVKSVRQFAKSKGALYIEWTPNITYQNTDDTGKMVGVKNDIFMAILSGEGFQHEPFTYGMSTTGSPSWEYVKDLKPFIEDGVTSKRYSKNVQYYLKKNKQFGIKLRQLKKEDLPAFKSLTQNTAERLNYHDKDLSFYETVYDVYGESAIFLFAELDFKQYIAAEQKKVTELNQKLDKIQQKIDKYPAQDKFKRQFLEFEDQKNHHVARITRATQQFQEAGESVVVIAGALFIQQAQEMTYLYSGTYEKYKEYYGPYQIQDEMISRAIEQQIPRYNFYGISGRFDGSDGVLGFKTAFEGQARQLVGRFILPVSPWKYRLYRLLKKLTGRDS